MSIKLFDLSGKTALVTGATHGLGMAIATGLAKAGARIIVNDIFPDKLEAAKKEYAANGIDVATFVMNVTDEAQVEEMIPQIEKEVAAIDILVNNAGIQWREPAEKVKQEDFERVMSTTNFSVPGGGPPGENKGPSVQTRNCSSGSCTTYEVPGPK